MLHIATMLWQYFQTKYRQPFRTREELVHWQNKKVETFLAKILPLSPFYREYYKDLLIRDWRNFPIIDKHIMMEHFDELNTAGIRKEQAIDLALQAEQSRNFKPKIRNITVGLSSGNSGGERKIFLSNNQECYRWAGTILAKLLPSNLFQMQRIALFLRVNSNLYMSLEQAKIQLRFFDLIDPVESHLKPLTDYRPTILVAPASLLRFLAEEKKYGKLPIQPIKIISVAEVLDPLDRKVIEDVFEQTIHQIYQSTEGFLATTCERGTLHINEDILVMQKDYIDKEAGKFSPIITDFYRTTQPIIRCRLNDLLIEKKDPCPCGSPFMTIQSIEGSCDDIFVFPATNQRKYIQISPDIIRKTIISAHPAIQEYLVIQHSTNQLEISLRTPDGMADQTSRAVVQSIRKLCQKFQCRVPDVLFTPYNRKPTIKKLKRIQRIFPLPTRYKEVFYDMNI